MSCTCSLCHECDTQLQVTIISHVHSSRPRVATTLTGTDSTVSVVATYGTYTVHVHGTYRVVVLLITATTERRRERETERDKDRKREADRETDRETNTERDKHREREREREGWSWGGGVSKYRDNGGRAGSFVGWLEKMVELACGSRMDGEMWIGDREGGGGGEAWNRRV